MSSLYPVGSIYLGTQSTCPLATLIPNSTWNLIAQDRALQGASNNHAAGTTIEAGLPNIVAEAVNVRFDQAYSTSGAFYTSNQNSGSGSGGGYDANLHLNASRSSSIYGKSSTVQPPAYVVNIWKRTA